MDPEPFRRFFGVQPRRLPRWQPTQEEPRAEANGARLRGHEVREIAQRAKVTAPAALGEQRAKVRPVADESVAGGIGARGGAGGLRGDHAPPRGAPGPPAPLLPPPPGRGPPQHPPRPPPPRRG